ncbi:MAG TPA: hypothetical protein VF100_12890 [Thermoanaerobaculia bacterium]
MRIERSFGFVLRRATAVAVVSLAVVLPAAAADPQEDDDPTVAETPSADQAPGAPGNDLERAQATMGRMLEVGRALHSWARDTRLERGRRQPTSRLPKELRWDRCPGLGHAELVELLVPAYLREVPEEDSWGRPLQFCLDRRLNAASQQYGVRSAGNDGDWENDPYRVGGFPETRLTSDLVWMDGYFVRWPEPQ